MFIKRQTYITAENDLSGRELLKRTETIYLFEGQEPDKNNLHPETQNYYKKLFELQEKSSLENKRPTCIFEALGFGLDNQITIIK